MFASLNEQMDTFRLGAVDVLPEEEFEKKIDKSIKTQKPLIIKLGADPSRPDLHIGHAVVLNKMRQFQNYGHHAILIIGDFTAMIGDPTGKSKTRPQLTLEETRSYGQTYLEQATKILSEERLEVRYNSEWLSSMSFADVISMSARYTVAQLLERDDFSKRYKSGTPISLHELLYPLAQAMDSVAIKSDVELGGTDQKFNLLVGRELQKAYNVEPQCILTMPILEGLDGQMKMSKSLDNYIGITESPREMFGKVMSIPDELITRYMLYAANANAGEVKEVELGLKSGSIHPRNAKVNLAKSIVALYHNFEAGESAFAEFERIFKNKDVPDDIELANIGCDNIPIMDLLIFTKLVPSKKEAKRSIEQGSVYIDGEKIDNAFAEIDLSTEKLLKVGKRKFLKIIK
jgi:tyrosyl-tRNA synthetase